MRSLISLSAILVGVAFLGACGSAPDSEADAAAGTESAAGGGMSAAEAAHDLSCWLGGATMEEAVQRISPLGETEIALGDHIGKICYGRAGEFEWQFFLTSDAERWGIPIDDAVRAADIGTFTGLPRALNEPVEQFTINWHTHGGDNGHLVLEWGTTRVEIEVSLLDHTH
jgi:hypothetical protein